MHIYKDAVIHQKKFAECEGKDVTLQSIHIEEKQPQLLLVSRISYSKT